MLVGHSWGGILIRGFSELYSAEVAGLAYIETIDVETTRQELADALPEAERKGALEPPQIPTIPPDTPPGLKLSTRTSKSTCGRSSRKRADFDRPVASLLQW
jgi:pimeloyl-ACP methyl ester carboxylesterase